MITEQQRLESLAAQGDPTSLFVCAVRKDKDVQETFTDYLAFMQIPHDLVKLVSYTRQGIVYSANLDEDPLKPIQSAMVNLRKYLQDIQSRVLS